MIALHQVEPSPFCDKIRRVLRYKRLPFELVDHPIADLRRVSPRTSKVPVLEVADKWIDDSTQIALWLDDAYPDLPLIPRAPRDRALCLALEDWADESLYFYELALHPCVVDNAAARTRTLVELESPLMKPLVSGAMSPYLRTVLRVQGTGRRSIDVIRQDVARHFVTVAGLVDGRLWLVGDAISLADIAVFVQLDLMWGTPEGRDIARRHAAVEAWADRVRAATGGRASGATHAGEPAPRRRGRTSIVPEGLALERAS